ncbi:MAG: 16S rRNA (adenine(1518)-N(6)/adenine(1519)-N(6))-dimethyltransferase RsmA [Lachnospiraceae bacterium]|nr:16S rRNA (adenine(1518)-N(6)/adenine(1519)-N(6))-dimethyltransferase RsmA [Lachnospiraceae bacterium]
MPDLATPSKTIEILKKHNFSFQKKYGQNFLIDRHILEKIVTAAEISKSDCVLEIGPGIGTMTQYLAEHAGKVIAVEIDKCLIPILEETLTGYDNVIIKNQDILRIDILNLVKEYNNSKPVKVVANLPYYITTPIIMALFEQHIPLETITLMVQKEVAERIKTGPGSKEYGALSLAVQYYAKPEIIAVVPPACFIPKPAVSSAVLHLKKHPAPTVNVTDEDFLFKIIRAAFNQRRKTLANALTNADNLKLTRKEITDTLKKMNLNESIRGEALSLAEFAVLSNQLMLKNIDNID